MLDELQAGLNDGQQKMAQALDELSLLRNEPPARLRLSSTNAGELGAASGAAASAMSPEAAAAASAMLQSEAAATWRASAWGIASE